MFEEPCQIGLHTSHGFCIEPSAQHYPHGLGWFQDRCCALKSYWTRLWCIPILVAPSYHIYYITVAGQSLGPVLDLDRFMLRVPPTIIPAFQCNLYCKESVYPFYNAAVPHE